MNNQRTRILRFWTPIVIFGLLTSGGLAQAQSDSEATGQKAPESRHSCSNRTLYGDYGATVEGFIPGAGISIRGVVVAHFDGRGNFTQVDHIVTNGMPPLVEWTPGNAVYNVKPDCTGKAVIHTSSSVTGVVNLHFVVVREGKEIRQVVDDNAVTAIAVKVE